MSQRVSDETLARIRAVVIDGETFYEPNQPMDRQHVQLWRDEVASLLGDLEETRAALQRTQWVYDSFCPGGSVPMGMICPVCANHRPEGHKPDCVVGNALGGSEQSS